MSATITTGNSSPFAWCTVISRTALPPASVSRFIEALVSRIFCTNPCNEPGSVCVDAVLAGLASGAAQVFVPEWFHGVTANKEKDVGAFLEGTAAYLRDQKQKKTEGEAPSREA